MYTLPKIFKNLSNQILIIHPKPVIPFYLQYSGLRNSLPVNVKIPASEPGKKQTLLQRLEYILEENEDSMLSFPAEVACNVRLYSKMTNPFSSGPLNFRNRYGSILK
jgi:hypothetical protein